MNKTTADRIKDYLKGHFYVEEAALPYEKKEDYDGRIIFFINKQKVEEKIQEILKCQIIEGKEEHYKKMMRILQKIIRNPLVDEDDKSDERIDLEGRLSELRGKIADEERKEIKKIIVKKFLDSQDINRTTGFFNTMKNMLAEKEDNGVEGVKISSFEKWQRENTPNLYDLEQGIYVEDKCKSDILQGIYPCGYCGDYFFLRKPRKEDEGKGDAKLLITNLEQSELIENDVRYVFGENADLNSPEAGKLRLLITNLIGKPFRERFNALRITKNGKKDGEDIIEDWEVYKNIEEAKEEFEPYK